MDMTTNDQSTAYPGTWCVVLNWKNWQATEMCVRSVAQSSRIARIVIVDNESDAEELRTWELRTWSTTITTKRIADRRCVVIASRTNRGFAAGVNLGIEYAIQQGAGAILLLNNDLIIGPPSIELMVELMATDENIGTVGVRIRFPPQDGRIGALQCLGGGFVSSKIGNVVQRQDASDKLDYLTGACMLIRRELALATQGFDERYFMYWEDVAFGLSAKALGYRNVVVDDRYAEHVLSGSRAQAGRLLEAYESWSAMTFASHAGGFLRVTVTFRYLLSCIYHVLCGRFSIASAKFMGIRFWARHRKVLQAYTVVDELWERMNRANIPRYRETEEDERSQLP